MTQKYGIWEQHLIKLRKDVDDFNSIDSGYSYSQKQELSGQRARLINYIKQDILEYQPFAEIAHKVCNSPFCFDECYDSMDGNMERTIKEIINMDIECL